MRRRISALIFLRSANFDARQRHSEIASRPARQLPPGAIQAAPNQSGDGAVTPFGIVRRRAGAVGTQPVLGIIPAGTERQAARKEARAMRASSLASILLLLTTAAMAGDAWAADCPATHDQLTQALRASVKPSGGPGNGGLDNNEWVALVARDGTANLYASAQPAGTLYGAQVSSPVVPDVLYAGDATQFGTASDPMAGKQLGGVITFGGGLALYTDSDIVGAIGVSGDTSCADHNVAWRVRHALGLDHVPAGVAPDHNNGIIYDMLPDKTSASGYGHITCKPARWRTGRSRLAAGRAGGGELPPAVTAGGDQRSLLRQPHRG